MLHSSDSSLFIDFSGERIGPNVKSQAIQEPFCLTFEDEWIVYPEMSITNNQRCVTYQKSEGLLYTVEEAWRHN
jgi:hypothetical protein